MRPACHQPGFVWQHGDGEAELRLCIIRNTRCHVQFVQIIEGHLPEILFGLAGQVANSMCLRHGHVRKAVLFGKFCWFNRAKGARLMHDHR